MIADLHNAREAAERLLSDVIWRSATVGSCRCPGADKHSNGNGDAAVFVDSGWPRVYCFHQSCSDDVRAVNGELLREAPEGVRQERKWTAAEKREWRLCRAIEYKARTEYLPKLLALPPMSADDWLKISPVSIPEKPLDQWRLFVRSMFTQSDLIWSGELWMSGEAEYCDTFRTAAEWQQTGYGPRGEQMSLVTFCRRSGYDIKKGSPTTENDMNKTETTPVAAAPTASPTLEQRFNQERKMRITGEVNRRAEGKINNSNLNWWIDQAMDAPTAEAEQAIYKQLDDMPKAAAPGGEAVRPDKVEAVASGRTPIFELPLAHGCVPRANKRLDWMEETRKIKSRADRIAATKKDWAAKLDYCYTLDARESKGLPQAANTYSSTLITDFLVDQAITILVGRFAALSSFSIEFGPDRYKEYATGQTKFVVSAGSTIRGTKTNPITNFQQGDATVVPISLPMTHYVKSFNVSQEDLMNGLRVENLMQLNLLQFTKDVTLDALSPIAGSAAGTQIPGPLNSSGNVTNYSAGTIHINAGTFGWNVGQTDGHDLASLWAYLKNSPEKNLILDGNFYGRLTNGPGMFQPTFGDERGGGDAVKKFGWDRLEENTVWPPISDSAGNAIGGLACNRQAILGVTG